jgi:YtcA-like protein
VTVPFLSDRREALGPQINVIGSFFPSWMLCAAIGIVIAVIARQVFLRVGVDPYLGPRALVYPSLALLVTLVLWVTWFRI